MKVFSVDQIRELDALTILHEPITSVDLMERAAKQCFNWLEARLPREKPYIIFCGPGNNGGDGLVIARLLAQKRRSVEVFLVKISEKSSDDFNINLEHLKKNPKVSITEIRKGDPIPSIGENNIIIDAIFGSGLTRPVSGWIAEIITHINNSIAFKKIAIDIPSGLFGDDNRNNDGAVIKADVTLTFQFPKSSFFFAENAQYTGEWFVLPIGLHPKSVSETETKNWFLEKDDCRILLRPKSKFSHKGTFGHALLLAGSYGKMGAAILASRAALRAGAGLVTAHVPSKGYQIIQTAVPEIMTTIDRETDYISEIPDIGNFNAIGIGPGIGMAAETQKALKVLIQEANLPLVIDADALNILGENKTWLAFLTPNTILTPHPKEFERMAGKASGGYDRWQKQIEFSRKFNVYVVLKGAFTTISCPDGSTYFNSTGNPGMATAGSGDVLTGIILGLKAQGYSSREACIIGVYMHGLAGDFAANQKSREGMIASDIMEFLGKAWKSMKTS